MKYTEKYINEMIEYYRNKLHNVKSIQEYDFYLTVLEDWKRRLNKIKGGRLKLKNNLKEILLIIICSLIPFLIPSMINILSELFKFIDFLSGW